MPYNMCIQILQLILIRQVYLQIGDAQIASISLRKL